MSKDIAGWPVMKRKCATCPFHEKTTDQRDLANAVRQRMWTNKVSQICHHPRLSGKKENKLCRGGRDHLLQIYYRMGVIEAETDAAWEKKRLELAPKKG